ncbi:hypothetical protein IMZ48_22115 [Candidatus Bathyarchaeota archaeon]|nr:hypothetical protein [Candidatus Bathyarchaeota archaeon]
MNPPTKAKALRIPRSSWTTLNNLPPLGQDVFGLAYRLEEATARSYIVPTPVDLAC